MAAQRNARILDRNTMEQLMFGTGRVRRFTQDSPVLPDVWLEYAKGPHDAALRLTSKAATDERFPPVKLLLSPFREAATGEMRRVVRERLRVELDARKGRGKAEPMPRVVYNQSTVAATLYFEDLIRVVLPMTGWWARVTSRWPVDLLQTKSGLDDLSTALMDPEHPPVVADPADAHRKRRLPPDLLWMIRVAGALALVRANRPLPAPFADPKRGVASATPKDWRVLARAIADLLKGVVPPPERPWVYSVSLNREATPTVARSTLAIKADAARRLFNISCKDLRWAVIDSGVDATHPAFRVRDPDGTLAGDEPFSVSPKGRPLNHTRIVETYDFTQIDMLLDPDSEEQPEQVKAALKSSPQAKELKAALEDLNRSLSSGRSVDWRLIAPLLRVPHDQSYKPPLNDHGTHVSGILAGDWRRTESQGLLEEDLIGVCPDLQLYDLRVLNAEGRGDEFAVMAALQFVRYLNSTHDYMAVHGVNLSLSIPHDIANYACGRTPICDECERTVAAGVVLVAAAGNQGYRKYVSADGITSEAYNSISISDPGNADLVITVGATHRFRPHTYGVSYFSSRGPTGDGRIKPDLVAPGEKITAPLPSGTLGLKDGTSMAAPHVSGAAALLMARYDELVGQPGRIKKILCETATDLGRERYFQGAGMLDVLRALQSV